MCYDYGQLSKDLEAIRDGYSFAEMLPIGRSVTGRSIHCLKIGDGRYKLMLAGAYHGLEYITAAFLARFAKDYAEHILSGGDFFGRDAARLFKAVSMYILPMINPDGVDLAINGADLTDERHRRLIADMGIRGFKGVWQANAAGVDLNHNYDALWSEVTDGPAPSKYGGRYPESEPETKAVTVFIRRAGINTLLAFHTQGEEIYCDFDGRCSAEARALAERMSRESGYAVRRPTGTAAFGGCKDWFIKEFGGMGFTIEAGRGKNPLPMSALADIYEPCARIALCAAEIPLI